MEIYLIRAVEALLYPPAGPLLLMALGALPGLRRRRLGRLLGAAGLLLLYLASAPFFSNPLIALLEQRHPPLPPAAAAAAQAEAIVVLGGERYFAAPEYGGATSGPSELERLRFAAALQRATGLPVTVVDGDPLGLGVDGAGAMKRVLEEEFRVPVRFADNRSRNTQENARYARELLQPHGIRRVLLVTHAWHMPRAMRAFADQGLDPVAAPTGFTNTGPLERGWLAFVPRDGGFTRTRRALHELLGLLWYGR